MAFKCKPRKHVAGADLLEVEKLIEAAEQKVEELSKKNAAAAAGGGGGASAAELAKAYAEVAKWKNLFQAAAADVDEKVCFRAFLLLFSLTWRKDEILAAQMAQIEELQALLAEKE